jgi:hypothetical protein
MKLLVVGDASSTYFISFINNLKKWDNTVEIDLLNTNSNIELPDIKRNYGTYYTNIYSYFKKITVVQSLPFLRGIVRVIYQRSVRAEIEKNTYDVVCMQGLFPHQRDIISWISKVSNFIVGVVWGSDFYKRDKNKAEQTFGLAAAKCDIICVSTDTFQKDIMDAYGFPSSKFRQCIFGTKTLEILFADQQSDNKEHKKRLSIQENDLVITCGHNGSMNQQHTEVIESLTGLRDILPANTLLLVPATYGGSEKYVAQIKELLGRSGLRYKLLEHFLTDDEVASIRKASDIFIQVQITDAYSASMQEHLFSKNIVITGDWLPYDSLIRKGIYFETVDHIGELSDKIKYVIENLDDLKNKASQINTPEKFRSSLWSVSIEDWYNMLNEYRR